MNADTEKERASEGADQFIHGELTQMIIKAGFDVANTLGCGFLEKVYENALVVGLKQMHLYVAQQVPVRILYLEQTVGDYIADLIVERKVLVEVKATAEDHPVHVAQTLNYLGYMLAEEGIRLEESLEMIKKALEKEPENGAYLDSHGWALFKLGKMDQAEKEIRKALRFLDSDAVVYEHLGDILKAKGKKREARKYWEKALKLDPENQGLKDKLEK